MTAKLFVPLVLLLVAACGTSRDAVLVRTTAGVDAAFAAFKAEDERLQMRIVDGAATRPEAEVKLKEHRAARDKVNHAFVGAYAGIAAAALSPSDATTARMVTLALAAMDAAKGWWQP